MFFEIPCTKTEEDELKKTRPKEMTSDGFYYNVYYLDNISKSFIKEILSMMGEVLLNDGLSSFWVGNFTTGDEIGKYKYNEVKILTENTKKYEKLLKNNEIKRNDEVVLARYLTSKDNPGVCTRYKDSEGRDVYKIVDALKEVEGFYKYRMRNNVTQDEVIIE